VIAAAFRLDENSLDLRVSLFDAAVDRGNIGFNLRLMPSHFSHWVAGDFRPSRLTRKAAHIR